MRILDNGTGKAIDEVTLYLTPDEAVQVRAALQTLMADPAQHHSHVNDDNYQREITIAIYTDENLAKFDAASQQLLKTKL